MKPAVSKLNKEWHQAHVMPKNASLDQRIEWHLQHRQHCGCRDIPEKLKKYNEGKRDSILVHDGSLF
ncbi:MAG: hypothetical protein IPI77_18180 [Saprospiraceae bacterium]|nr:hypothetical protein [Saprospiraceae bacterium]